MNPLLNTPWTLVAGVIVLFLPGFAWLAFFWEDDQDAFERLAEALGISIALTAVVALAAFLLDLQVTAALLITSYLLLLLPAFITTRRWWRQRTWGGKNSGGLVEDRGNSSTVREQDLGSSNQVSGLLDYLVLALVFLVILVWRFYQIREVVLPLWVDSVHHVQIVSLFLDNGGIPETLQPQMPVPFYYHYAFHALGAAFSFISRLHPADGVLYLGQVLNAAIALGIYRLGKALWGDWRRAIIAALLVGFVTQMPAYYLTWGRYTLLTGILLLLLAMAAALDIVNKSAGRSRLVNFGLLTAGILLTHYFAAALLAIFLVILGIQVLVNNIRQRKSPIWETVLQLFLTALAGLLVASPWLYRMWGYARRGVQVVSNQPNQASIDALYFPDYLSYLWRLLGPVRNQALLFAALPGLIITLLRKRSRAFGVWTIVLILLSLPLGFYVSPFRPDHAVIVLFLPTAMMIAELMVSVIDWNPLEKFIVAKTIVVLLVLALLVGWGIYDTRSVINSATVLATGDDREALNWIQDNTPQDARFGINVVHWQYGSYRGVDGGWWIEPLTGRRASHPNILYVMGEREYAERVNAFAGQFSQLVGCSTEFWELVEDAELTHIYLSANKGTMQPSQFSDCPGVEPIYHNESVYLYRIEYIIKPDSS